MADSRYNRFDNQAPVQTALKADDVSVGRSAFDWSCIHNGNALVGALVPVDCFDVVPNEDIDYSISAMVELRNPTTRQLFNGFRVFFHTYYNRLTDLWEGAKNWLDNGRTGKINLTRPNLIYKAEYTGSSPYIQSVNACTPMSLLNYLGLPAQEMNQYNATAYTASGYSAFADAVPLRSFQPAVSWNSSHDTVKLSEAPDFFPADCCFAYQRNWRDFYCNKNLLQNNPYWFPDNEEHFILSYNCANAVCINYGAEGTGTFASALARMENISSVYPTNVGASYIEKGLNHNSVTPEPNNPLSSEPFESSAPSLYPNLSGLKFRQFRGDRFTTALPFPDLIRGDLPLLELNDMDLGDLKVDTAVFSADGSTHDITTITYSGNAGPAGVNYIQASSPSTPSSNTSYRTYFTSSEPLSVSSSITMSDIYTLETLTAFRRRMGMTNGDYNEMIKS